MIKNFIKSKNNLYLWAFVLGIFLYILDATIFGFVRLITPTIGNILDEFFILVFLVTWGILGWRFHRMKYGFLLIAFLFVFGFKILPVGGVLLTKHTFPAKVIVAGMDESNKGKNVIFKATILKDGDKDSIDYRVQDAMILPPYWWQFSSNTRTKLREAASLRKEVCITAYGFRNGLLSTFPNVVNVSNIEN